jgi:hypothetical protein
MTGEHGMDSSLGKLLIFAGLGLVVLGLAVLVGGRIGLGRLPGDVVIRGERWTFYFPIVTCLVLSLVLTLLLWLVGWLRR